MLSYLVIKREARESSCKNGVERSSPSLQVYSGAMLVVCGRNSEGQEKRVGAKFCTHFFITTITVEPSCNYCLPGFTGRVINLISTADYDLYLNIRIMYHVQEFHRLGIAYWEANGEEFYGSRGTVAYGIRRPDDLNIPSRRQRACTVPNMHVYRRIRNMIFRRRARLRFSLLGRTLNVERRVEHSLRQGHRYEVKHGVSLQHVNDC